MGTFSAGLMQSDVIHRQHHSRCSCDVSTGDGTCVFFYFTICSTCKRVAFIATLINPGCRNFHLNFNRPASTSCCKVQSKSRKGPGLFAMLVKRHQSLGAVPNRGQQHQQQRWKKCTSKQGQASMKSESSQVSGDA